MDCEVKKFTFFLVSWKKITQISSWFVLCQYFKSIIYVFVICNIAIRHSYIMHSFNPKLHHYCRVSCYLAMISDAVSVGHFRLSCASVSKQFFMHSLSYEMS